MFAKYDMALFSYISRLSQQRLGCIIKMKEFRMSMSGGEAAKRACEQVIFMKKTNRYVFVPYSSAAERLSVLLCMSKHKFKEIAL